MNIAIFGGSGTTGRAVIDALLGSGCEVRALCRSAASLDSREGLTLIEGSLLDPQAVAKTLQATDAVLCLFGPRPPYSDIFCADATATVVQAMRECEISRLICLTGAMIGDYPDNRSWTMRIMCRSFNRRFPALADDRRRQEQIITNSRVQWLIIKPPRLTNDKAKPLLCGTETRVGMLSSVSRHSIAEWIVRELRYPLHLREIHFLRQEQ